MISFVTALFSVYFLLFYYFRAFTEDTLRANGLEYNVLQIEIYCLLKMYELVPVEKCAPNRCVGVSVRTGFSLLCRGLPVDTMWTAAEQTAALSPAVMHHHVRWYLLLGYLLLDLDGLYVQGQRQQKGKVLPACFHFVLFCIYIK